MARPGAYERKIEPYLSKIEQMALTMTEEQMAKTLGISYSTWRRCKGDHEQLQAVLKSGRKDLVTELKSTLIEKAKGYRYTEIKTIKELNRETGELEVVRQEETTKNAHPDVAAINLLLKNYDKDAWANDPQMLELRKQELELRQQQADGSEW